MYMWTHLTPANMGWPYAKLRINFRDRRADLLIAHGGRKVAGRGWRRRVRLL